MAKQPNGILYAFLLLGVLIGGLIFLTFLAFKNPTSITPSGFEKIVDLHIERPDDSKIEHHLFQALDEALKRSTDTGDGGRYKEALSKLQYNIGLKFDELLLSRIMIEGHEDFLVVGRCGFERLDNAVKDYISHPNKETIGAVIEADRSFAFYRWGIRRAYLKGDGLKACVEAFNDWNSVKVALENQIDTQQDWALFEAIYEKGSFDNLLIKYPGSKTLILENRGMLLQKQGKLLEAYNDFAASALADNRNASFARGMAHHYGCTDLAAIWGGLTEYSHDFEGEAMPPLPATLSHDELHRARMKLRNGDLPEVPESCVISRY